MLTLNKCLWTERILVLSSSQLYCDWGTPWGLRGQNSWWVTLHSPSYAGVGWRTQTLPWNRPRSFCWYDVGPQFFCLHNVDNSKCLLPRMTFKLNQNNICRSFSSEPRTLIAQQMLAAVICWPFFLWTAAHVLLFAPSIALLRYLSTSLAPWWASGTQRWVETMPDTFIFLNRVIVVLCVLWWFSALMNLFLQLPQESSVFPDLPWCFHESLRQVPADRLGSFCLHQYSRESWIVQQKCKWPENRVKNVSLSTFFQAHVRHFFLPMRRITAVQMSNRNTEKFCLDLNSQRLEVQSQSTWNSKRI